MNARIAGLQQQVNQIEQELAKHPELKDNEEITVRLNTVKGLLQEVVIYEAPAHRTS